MRIHDLLDRKHHMFTTTKLLSLPSDVSMNQYNNPMNSSIPTNFQEDDDDDDWSPIEDIDAQFSVPPTNHDTINAHDGSIPTCTSSSYSNRDNYKSIFGSQHSRSGYDTNRNLPSANFPESAHGNRNTFEVIRAKHERNINLKQNFVERPLVLFPKLLLYHLMTEFWKSDRSIRIGK